MGDFRGGEGVHWYASDRTVAEFPEVAQYAGQSVDKVPGARGHLVKADKRHAIKYHLAAGCTGVLSLYHKEALIDWSARMAALAVAEPYCIGDDEEYSTIANAYKLGVLSKEDYTKLAVEGKDKVKEDAAAGGTSIHGDIEKGFLATDPESPEAQHPTYLAVLKILRETYGKDVVWVPEKPVYHPLGFGARTDILGKGDDGRIIVVDFKTRVFDAEDVDAAVAGKAKGNKTFGKLTPYDTEPWQVAANLVGHARLDGHASFTDRTLGGNLYISRTDPTLVHLHTYSSQELGEAWECFKHLHAIFVIVRGVPGR